MAGRYKVLEKVAISDAAFEARGDTLSDLFGACAYALMDTLVKTTTVGNSYKHTIQLQNKDIEKLLYDLLEELIYLKDKDAVVFSACDVIVKEDKNIYNLDATLKGEKINLKKHKLGQDVKAITMHMFKVEKKGKGYLATFVLDI
jgi:SHS2 domain-containing protein